MTISTPDPSLRTPRADIDEIGSCASPETKRLSIEDAIRTILRSYIFAPNDLDTWANVTEAVSDLLTTRWKDGELTGATACDAFSVTCGLGSTMTPDDISNGDMRFTAMLCRAGSTEPTELTVSQKMAG